MTHRIALIGTTGTNSRHWTDAFLKAGWSVRSLMRDPSRLTPRPNQTAQRFDLDDTETYEPALAGADVLGLVTPPDLKQVERESALIAAGTYTEPLGSARITFIDVRDTADAAVAVAGGGFDRRALVLTGSDALTGPEIAAVLSEGCGHPVRFISPDLQSFKAALDAQGAPGWRADSHLELYSDIQGGRAPHLAVISHDFTTLTGKKPRTLLEFIRAEFPKQQ